MLGNFFCMKSHWGQYAVPLPSHWAIKSNHRQPCKSNLHRYIQWLQTKSTALFYYSQTKIKNEIISLKNNNNYTKMMCMHFHFEEKPKLPHPKKWICCGCALHLCHMPSDNLVEKTLKACLRTVAGDAH